LIFGSETISTYTRTNVSIWLVLAFQAGYLNIGGYLACHSFVSHVTGFYTLFGHEFNRTHFWAASAMLLVPGFFLMGTMVSGYLIDLRIQMRKAPKYYIVFGIMFLLLLFVVVGGFNHLFAEFGTPMETTEDYSLLILLCLVCGIQNGMVTLVSRAVVRTTHMTGLTTDLGVGLMRVWNQKLLKKRDDGEMRANYMRIGIIVCFTLGSALAASIFEHFAYRGFIVPVIITGLLFSICFYFQVLRANAVST